MRLDYHDLSDKDFEGLVVLICAEILGSGVVPFCSGPDGARDARFDGTAADLPNAKAPLKGKFIVQAKQTEHPFAKFSDPSFSGDADSSTVSAEIPGIKQLVGSGELDHYLLFANRRMSGVAEGPIRERIAKATEAKTVELFGIERMDLYLKRFPQIVRSFTQQAMPLLVVSDELAEVILAISQNSDTFKVAFDPDSLNRKSFADKNEENGLSERYAKRIREKFLPQFGSIKAFLAKPGNEEIIERYESAANEFDHQIEIHRSQYEKFDDVLERILGLLFSRDGDLSRVKRLTRLVIYYMYFNCDIGTRS